MEPKELKEKVRAIMMAHLKTKGYPDMSTQQILSEVPAMFILVQRSGLIPRMKFSDFSQLAMFKAMQSARDKAN